MHFKGILFGLALAVVLSACNQPAPAETNDAANTEANQQMENEAENLVEEGEAMMEEGEEKMAEADYEVDMSNFEFSVTEMTAAPGDTVVVEVTNVEGTHDFVLDEFDVNSGIVEEGNTQTVEITIPEDAEPGEYEYYCSVGQHREMGMVGTLTVTE